MGTGETNFIRVDIPGTAVPVDTTRLPDQPEEWVIVYSQVEWDLTPEWHDGKSIAITGGTGSLGTALARRLLDMNFERIVIFSRRWQEQKRLREELGDDPRLRFFIGDVRDRDRLEKAFANIDYVIHAAAFKDVPSGQYNPEEVIATNINGSMNVFDAAIKAGVEKVLAISSDKASSPHNLYGTTKAVMEHAAINWNAYGANKTVFSVCRYGNVVGSSGSVVPIFKQQAETGVLTVTVPEMTRFWIRMQDAVTFVLRALEEMTGGEIFVPKLKSSTIVEMAEAVAPTAEIKIVGIRPGEKIHEQMIGQDEIENTRDIDWAYAIYPPSFQNYPEYLPGSPYQKEEPYTSENAERYTGEELRGLIWGE